MTIDELKKKSADLAAGVASLDRKIAEVEHMKQALTRNRIATDGARQVIDELIVAEENDAKVIEFPTTDELPV